MTGLAERCEQVLEGSWNTGERDGVRYAYTRPSPGRYRWQWYWDSCLAAIAWRHFDPTWILQPDESGLDASPLALARMHLLEERREDRHRLRGCFQLLIDQIRPPLLLTNSSRDIVTPPDLPPSGVGARVIVERPPDHARRHECPDIGHADLRVR